MFIFLINNCSFQDRYNFHHHQLMVQSNRLVWLLVHLAMDSFHQIVNKVSVVISTNKMIYVDTGQTLKYGQSVHQSIQCTSNFAQTTDTYYIKTHMTTIMIKTSEPQHLKRWRDIKWMPRIHTQITPTINTASYLFRNLRLISIDKHNY